MTLADFMSVTDRIPTPAEFVSFAEANGVKLAIGADGRGIARGPSGDPLVRTLARMLGREPYRSGVLALLQERWRAAPPVAQPVPEVCTLSDAALVAIAERAYIDEPAWGGGMAVLRESVILSSADWPATAFPAEFVEWWSRHNAAARARSGGKRPERESS